MVSCREASRLTSESLDRPLGRRERFALRLHLLLCGACSRYHRQLSTMRRVIRFMSRHPAAVHQLSPSAKERIRRSLKDAR
ncbi:MAG: zf-HC2 domain-containing protein [Chitinivibrionales bacterium]|nr:zf-HC2 domain-containing protein [Chitinivibrionales bacterium]